MILDVMYKLSSHPFLSLKTVTNNSESSGNAVRLKLDHVFNVSGKVSDSTRSRNRRTSSYDCDNNIITVIG